MTMELHPLHGGAYTQLVISGPVCSDDAEFQTSDREEVVSPAAAEKTSGAGTIHARLDLSTGLHLVVGIDGKPIADCAKFLERLAVRGLSPRTIEAYAYDLALVHRWLLAANLELEQLNVDHVYQSITRRSRRDYEMGIQRVRCAPTRQLRVKEARTVVEPLSLEQVQELLSSLRRYRDLCIAHAMLLCGLRTQEVLNLRLVDIDFTDRRIRILGKGNKERLVPPHLRHVADEWRDEPDGRHEASWATATTE